MDVTAEARRARDKAEDRLLSLPGVVGVGIGLKISGGERTETLAIRVLVERKQEMPHDQRIPSEVAGIPTDVVEARIVAHPVSAPAAASAAPDQSRHDPLRGGISVGPCRQVNGLVYGGTLAYCARHIRTGRVAILSSFHTFCIDRQWSRTDRIAQPSRVDDGVCPADAIGSVFNAKLGDTVDCAAAFLGTRTIAPAIVDVGSVAGPVAPSLGQVVLKRGRTTRVTQGSIDAVNLTVHIDYGPLLQVITLRDQIGIAADQRVNTAFGDKGDSGALVVTDRLDAVGLYVAGDPNSGYGIANQIDDVLVALDITLCPPAQPKPKEIAKEALKEFKEKEGAKEKDVAKEAGKEKEGLKEKEAAIKEKEFKFEKELKAEKECFKWEIFKEGKFEKDQKDSDVKWVYPKIEEHKDDGTFEKMIKEAPELVDEAGAKMGDVAPWPGGEPLGVARAQKPGPSAEHFIGRDLRPDLGRGALIQEPDAPEFPPADKPKKTPDE